MADLADLLEKTSRTFALSIPVLPEPTRREVMIAYLLFRIADTFEDAAHWPPEKRIAAIGDFNALLTSYSRPEAERLSQRLGGGRRRRARRLPRADRPRFPSCSTPSSPSRRGRSRPSAST